ncbi:MAG: hypothetical protein ACRDND_02665 [Streptosporangiaceae bacterium]
MTVGAGRYPSDRHGEAPGRVRQTALPAGARELSTLARIDYEDAFVVDTGLAQDRTAEQWAREILEGAPVGTRTALTRGWSRLGLRLGPAQSDRHVLGWEIRRSSPDVVLLGACGRLGLSGELIFQRSPRSLLYATVVQLENRIASGLWAAIASRHRRVVRGLLERA